MGRLPMAFRMMAGKGPVRASQKRWVDPAFWPQASCPILFFPSGLRTFIAFFSSRKIKVYFTRVGIPVNKKLASPQIFLTYLFFRPAGIREASRRLIRMQAMQAQRTAGMEKGIYRRDSTRGAIA